MLVSKKDGCCRECKGELDITSVDEDLMEVECLNPKCGECYNVEIDAFGDGGVHYWPTMMAEQGQDENS